MALRNFSMRQYWSSSELGANSERRIFMEKNFKVNPTTEILKNIKKR